MKRKLKYFRIPVMRIQAVLLSLDEHPKLVDLRAWIIEKVEEERGNWGIEGKGYRIDYDLERQWYPIFVFSNRWIANAFVEHLVTLKGRQHE